MGQWVDGSVGRWVSGSMGQWVKWFSGSMGQCCQMCQWVKWVAFLCASHVSWLSRYLTTILRQSYDNVKVVIDLRPMSNLDKTSYNGRKAFFGTIHLRNRYSVNPLYVAVKYTEKQIHSR